MADTRSICIELLAESTPLALLQSYVTKVLSKLLTETAWMRRISVSGIFGKCNSSSVQKISLDFTEYRSIFRVFFSSVGTTYCQVKKKVILMNYGSTSVYLRPFYVICNQQDRR